MSCCIISSHGFLYDSPRTQSQVALLMLGSMLLSSVSLWFKTWRIIWLDQWNVSDAARFGQNNNVICNKAQFSLAAFLIGGIVSSLSVCMWWKYITRLWFWVSVVLNSWLILTFSFSLTPNLHQKCYRRGATAAVKGFYFSHWKLLHQTRNRAFKKHSSTRATCRFYFSVTHM